MLEINKLMWDLLYQFNEESISLIFSFSCVLCNQSFHVCVQVFGWGVESSCHRLRIKLLEPPIEAVIILIIFYRPT